MALTVAVPRRPASRPRLPQLQHRHRGRERQPAEDLLAGAAAAGGGEGTPAGRGPAAPRTSRCPEATHHSRAGPGCTPRFSMSGRSPAGSSRPARGSAPTGARSPAACTRATWSEVSPAKAPPGCQPLPSGRAAGRRPPECQGGYPASQARVGPKEQAVGPGEGVLGEQRGTPAAPTPAEDGSESWSQRS